MWLLLNSHLLSFGIGVTLSWLLLRPRPAPPPQPPAAVPVEPPPEPRPLSPFEGAHARASFAVLLAGVEHVRARLDAGYADPKLRALGWLLAELKPLAAAMGGDSRWDPTRVQQRLHELDLELGPDSWWRKSQRLDEWARSSPGLYPPPPDVPSLAEIYGSVFELAEARRLKRKERRLRERARRAEPQAGCVDTMRDEQSLQRANLGELS